jgi:hypothetical protein
MQIQKQFRNTGPKIRFSVTPAKEMSSKRHAVERKRRRKILSKVFVAKLTAFLN